MITKSGYCGRTLVRKPGVTFSGFSSQTLRVKPGDSGRSRTSAQDLASIWRERTDTSGPVDRICKGNLTSGGGKPVSFLVDTGAAY
ncbi:hypothetical protein QTO34_019732 [Cnephaeus nilssonii]|uniref:Uncharacterized protein n=1 Tax=Cnephaeus nilssonii TaxID=3371016 RepID=A0AA40LPI7_CNENI|nr:hypothetical protein QTO34_019732 [Eptesicus nilssonii]